MSTTLRLVAILGVLAAPAAAQAQAAPADSVLAAITARGWELVRYDIAAWHGGDALEALKPDMREINASFARVGPRGKWEVVYGRLTEKKDTFFVTYRAVQFGPDSQFAATRVAVPEPDIAAQREMALDFQIAQQDFGPVTRPYNAAILPAPAGGFWVYLLPAQTDPRNFPLGGDVRYWIVNGAIVAKVRFHTAILDRPTPTPGGGQQLVAMMHTSFDSLPSETDVFVVLRRVPKLPEVVATKNFNYQIAVDGTIKWARAARGP